MSALRPLLRRGHGREGSGPGRPRHHDGDQSISEPTRSTANSAGAASRSVPWAPSPAGCPCTSTGRGCSSGPIRSANYCGDGCQITVQTKDNELIEVNSSYGAGRNNGDLCARGFFGFHATSHPDRLTKPLIRRNGLLEATTWEEALEYVAEQIARLKVAHGADAFGGLISSRCTNEELYCVPEVYAARDRDEQPR